MKTACKLVYIKYEIKVHNRTTDLLLKKEKCRNKIQYSYSILY